MSLICLSTVLEMSASGTSILRSFRLLEDQFFIHQLVDDGEHEGVEGSRVRGQRSTFLPLLNDAFLQVGLRDDDVADDGDYAVERRSLHCTAGGLKRRRGESLCAKEQQGGDNRAPRQK